jgi:hypothetical protein
MLMIKGLVRKQFIFERKLAENLRKMAYVNRCTETSIVKNALNFYFSHPEEGKAK